MSPYITTDWSSYSQDLYLKAIVTKLVKYLVAETKADLGAKVCQILIKWNISWPPTDCVHWQPETKGKDAKLSYCIIVYKVNIMNIFTVEQKLPCDQESDRAKYV